MTVRKLEIPNNGGPQPDGDAPRVETGAVQFGNDWPGYFIRGDGAMHLAMQINTLERALGLFNGGHMTKQEFLNLVTLPMMEISSLKKGILVDTIVGMDTTPLKDGSDWRNFQPAEEERDDETEDP